MKVALLATLSCLCLVAGLPRIEHAITGERPTAPPVTEAKLNILWGQKVCELKTEPTLQAVVNPLLERESPVHDQVFQSLADLRASNIRFVPWYPYPKLGVAELEPPTATSTSWNFTLLDPLMEDFMKAAGNGSVIINFSTPPTWLYNVTDWSYPANPNDEGWTYEAGTVLRDQSMREFAEYYKRLVSWYIAGGFVDELGVEHKSPYHFNIDKWEVLNEVEFEHDVTQEGYTRQYDAVVAAIKELPNAPKEFVGLAFGRHNEFDWYKYFLNSSNHAPNTPLDWISYHFYGQPSDRYNPLAYEAIFPAADQFADEVKTIEGIRKSLSPSTRTTIDEIGTILPDDNSPNPNPPNSYWAASGAMYAYVFNLLSQQQIDILGESQLTGLPQIYGYAPQYPSVSLLDWNTGYGNPRYWVLHEMISVIGEKKHTLVKSESSSSDVSVQAFVCDEDKSKWMIVVNKRYANITVDTGVYRASIVTVDADTFGPSPPVAEEAHSLLHTIKLHMSPFSVSFLSL